MHVSKFIVDVTTKRLVHKRDNIQPECDIENLPQTVDVDMDYTEDFKGIFYGCPHCYPEKAEKEEE